MGVWISTAALVIVLVAIVRTEIRCGRRTKTSHDETNRRIDDLARSTFTRYQEKFGRDPTGSFPLQDNK